MGFFGKKSSRKILALDLGADAAPRQSPFGSGGPTSGSFGSRETAAHLSGQQQPSSHLQIPRGYPMGASQQGYAAPQQASGPEASYGGLPPSANGQGQQSYGGYNPQQEGQIYQQQKQQSMFRDARPSSNGFGSDLDQTTGGFKQTGKIRNLANNLENKLEAEYDSGLWAQKNQGSGAYDSMEQQSQAQDEEDDEAEAIKQQMRFTKQESLNSTRNALRIARETEETATGTILKLGEQSDKIANTERHLDMSKAHSSRADDNAKEIVALNRSIFRPNVQFNKEARRDAEEARILNRHIEEREERETVRAEALKSQVRADRTLTGAGTGSGRFPDRFESGRFPANKQKPEDAQKSKLSQRSRYQFDATESDDELEDELENNLDEIGQVSARLNQLGRAMGTEIDEQNNRIQRISEKANKLDTRVYGSTQKLERIK